MMGVTVGDCKIRSCNSCTLWKRTVVMVVLNWMQFGLNHNPSFHLCRKFQHSLLLYLLPIPSLSYWHTHRTTERRERLLLLHSFCLSSWILIPPQIQCKSLCNFWHLLEQFLLISWDYHFVSFLCFKWSAPCAPK